MRRYAALAFMQTKTFFSYFNLFCLLD
jgi:hypothetical protein